ncbi:peptide MFS transporter [Sphingomonas sp.]|uniref:peptide MFS transporter n=1 Tax=Sphingomonas sp. TaxID=28214 RepID=UPI003B003A12
MTTIAAAPRDNPVAAPSFVPDDRSLFGHPIGLTVLAGTELWERFSFYGMQALLMLYMTKYLLLPEHARHVLGLADYRAALSAVFGPMTDLAFAAQTYGLYSGLIYATPLSGAWLGDRVLGKTRTVTIGTLLMAVGHLAMASEFFFLAALLLLILGAGCVIGNMAAQVGQLYAPDDHRRTRAFGLYLLALNIGALTAPLIVGTLGEKVGWHSGFGAAGFGMLIGLTVYLSGRRYLPPDVITRRGEHARLDRRDWRVIAALLVMLLPYILAGAALNQAYGIMYVWADTAVDGHILGWEMPVTWVGIFDGAMTIVGVLVANAYWKRSAARGREMGDLAKIGVSCAGIALSYLYIGAVALLPVVPIALWLGFYVVIDLATVWQEAPPQAIISRSAPVSLNATMMAVFKLANTFAYFLLGWLGRFYETLGPAVYWASTALLPLVGLAIMLVYKGRITRVLDKGAAVALPQESAPRP